MFSSSKNMSIVKGMGIGLAVGTAAAVMGSKMMTAKGKRACRRNATKCMRAMEDVMNGISSSMLR